MNTATITGAQPNNKVPGHYITPPPDFPVTWKNPDDANHHWTRDREHMPAPITPMFQSVADAMAIESRDQAAAVYEEPIVHRRDQSINTYNYTCLLSFQSTPEELNARARRNRNKVSAISARLRKIWESEWKPALEAIWQFWAAFDLANADLPALSAHLEQSISQGARLYYIHYLMGPPMWFAIDEFEALYGDLFPGATRLDAHRLLQGFDNKTLESGRALWRLSRLAQAVPQVNRALAELPAAEVLAALDGQASAAFLQELGAFLSTYGRRSNLWDWGYPSWEDDPTPVIANLKNYIAQPDRDLASELAQAAAERVAAVAKARRRLIGYPQPVIERFEKSLQAAQIALVLTEDHTYYIDFNGFGWLHRLIHEFGKRFAAQGRLDCAGDIFYLTLAELRAMIADPTLTHRDLAVQRRSQSERWAKYAEPAELGTRPAAPLYMYSPDARRVLRYVGGFAADALPPVSEPGVVRGTAGSPGKVRGVARLILSLSEANRLQQGDILVTTTTAPPWTPLFLTAAAVVTDMGGLLSHGAVVSREYRIPAVVGTHCATARIADGQTIEVDGDNGIVRFWNKEAK